MKFEYFGQIGNPKLRKQLAEAIYHALQSPSGTNVSLPDLEVQNYLPAINKILENNTLRQLCQKDPQLAEVITQEILDFLNGAKREINITESPFAKEQLLLSEFADLPKTKFKNEWGKYEQFLKKNYASTQINTEFYAQEFKSLEKSNPRADAQSFESIKEHLADGWRSLLFNKQTAFELSIIDQWRKKITEDLYKRIEELKKLQDILEPITGELGRLWDMSKGNWQKINFDVLKHYADLLKKDKAIAELAEMLGRMRQAEREYEEETFINIIPQPKWIIEPAHKSDLIGIHESDDISNMLPSETAFLSDPVLQTIFVKKFAEKKLQTFEFQSRSLQYQDEEVEEKRLIDKEQGKGPFIICVDTSGSMHGTPETIAKTLCFAILKIALQDKRKCYLISYSTGINTLELTEVQRSLSKLIDFLQMSFHGGTDATPAVKEALKMLETQDYKNADVLMISDFIMAGFDTTTNQQITHAKENNTKFHSLVIGQSGNQQVMNSFDHNWTYNPQNPNALLLLVKNLRGLNS